MRSDVVGVSEIAGIIGWHPRRVRRALERGELPTEPRSSARGHWGVRLEALRAYQKRTKKKANRED